MSNDVGGPSQPGFWEQRYREGRTGWDLGEATPAWERLVALHGIEAGRTLVLGAGRGHDALWFAAKGFEVTAVDFARSAVDATREAAREQGLSVKVQEADLFTLAPERIGWFDLVVEHTCFCAIEPERRAEYVEVVSKLVRPGGLFLGVFFWHLPPGGPPFATPPEVVRPLFEPAFELLRLESNPVSVPARAGTEGWAVFRRRETSAQR